MDVWWQSLETVGKRVQLARQLRHVELHYLRRTILFAEDFFAALFAFFNGAALWRRPVGPQ
jgi:hypothetical protein